MMRRAILIAGLRRSGTTALWECFRAHDGLAAFDEPLHPRLVDGARANPKGTWTELAAALTRLNLVPQAIQPLDELDIAVSDAEKDYFLQLVSAAPRVVIDEVRVWNRLPALFATDHQVLTVHLVRDPAGWVTGHLMPSGRPTHRRRLANFYRRVSFFARRGFYDNYHYQTIIEAALARGHSLWSTVNLPHGTLARAPAYVKLLAFWWGSNLAMHRALVSAGVPRMLVTQNEFIAAPHVVLDRILVRAGWSDLVLSADHVHRPRQPVAAGDRRWTLTAQRLGIPVEVFNPAGAGFDAFERAFDEALAKETAA